MRWFAISGSWREADERVKADVERAVRKIVVDGDGIVTGGALGVDAFATQVVLEEGDPARQLIIFLPIPFDAYCRHMERRCGEGVITEAQRDLIISQLSEVRERSPACISDESGYTKAGKESYYARNTTIVEQADELFAFQVNGSKGTQDAIDKARDFGKPVSLWTYTV